MWEQKTQAQFETTGIAYFYALRGLVQSGLGLSAAMIHLSQVQKTPFAAAMSRSLERFEKGQGFQDCLDRFHARLPSKRVGLCLKALHLAYQQGLAAGPILDRIIPVLEAEQDAVQRLRTLRQSAAAQAAVAFCMPWLVFAVLAQCEPGVLEGVFDAPSGWAFLAGILGLECVGAAFLWMLSRFY